VLQDIFRISRHRWTIVLVESCVGATELITDSRVRPRVDAAGVEIETLPFR